jgi:hypothetical protein
MKAVVFYVSETWRVTNTNSNELHAFIKRCLRHIMNIRWFEKILVFNATLWERANQNPISQKFQKQKWNCRGHTLRRPVDNIAKQALDWNPQGKTKADMETISR